MYAIGDVVRLTGMSQHTLRLYEEAGFFVDPPRRDARGNRSYDDADVDWLQRLGLLRAAGMPVAEIARYVRLVRAGAPDDERLAVLAAHRDRVAEQVVDAQERLALMEAKIGSYRERLDRGLSGAPWPEAAPRS